MSDEIPAPLLELDDALQLLAKVVQPIIENVTLPLDEALGCVTMEKCVASYALPPFDNTGVDGYAFRHAECKNGRLKLAGQSLAGEPLTEILPPGCAAHIATGAVLPSGADTVVMQEHVHIEGEEIVIDSVPPKGANIRRAGFDIKQNEVAIHAYKHLQPQDIALLCALGFTSVKVFRPLRIGILATGTELREAGAKLKDGQIIDTNSLMLKQMFFGLPVNITMLGVLPDDRGATDAVLQKATENHDLIISTGGVSVGRRDFIRDALKELGKVHFWKLALRPGRPVMFGKINRCMMLGLPGNPVSVMVTFMLVGRPLLQALWGMTPSLPPAFHVRLIETVRKEKHLRSFPRARLEWRDNEWQAVPFHDQSSNLLTSLSRSDGMLDLPTGLMEITEGSQVQFRPFSGISF